MMATAPEMMSAPMGVAGVEAQTEAEDGVVEEQEWGEAEEPLADEGGQLQGPAAPICMCRQKLEKVRTTRDLVVHIHVEVKLAPPRIT